MARGVSRIVSKRKRKEHEGPLVTLKRGQGCKSLLVTAKKKQTRRLSPPCLLRKEETSVAFRVTKGWRRVVFSEGRVVVGGNASRFTFQVRGDGGRFRGDSGKRQGNDAGCTTAP